MLRWRNRWVAWGALAFVAAALALVSWGDAKPRTPAIGPNPVNITATSQPAAASCKVSPDVTVTLTAGISGADWRVHVEALAPASHVVVSIGARNATADGNRRLVWRGSLGRGEQRDFQVGFAPASAANEVWAEAAIEGGAIQRSRAAVSVQDGKPVASIAASETAGRLVQDPQSGETVLELPGAVGGSR